VSLLSSPRRRRRLAWLAAVVVLGGVAALVVSLLPTHGSGLPRHTARGAPTFTLGTQPRAEARAQAAAAEIVQPLASTFVSELAARRRLASAYALLAPGLRAHYSLADWEAGRDLPLPAIAHGYADTSTLVSFTGPTLVGVVASATPKAAAATGSDIETLLAVRFVKTRGRWLVDYLQRGHSSSLVTAQNYAPPGFLPGTHRETFWTWAALIGGFVAVVAIVVFLDRLLSRPSRPRSV